MIQVLLTLVALQSGPADPAWNVRLLGARAARVEVVFPASADADSSAAGARLVPAPGGELPRVELVEADSHECRMASDECRVTEGPMVRFGQPMVAAGLEVAPLILTRCRGLGEGRAVEYHRLVVRLSYEQPLAAMRGKGEMARLVCAEFGADEPGQGSEAAGYLIIVPDDFYSNVLPLAAWKERKGFKVWVKRTSETGVTKEQIQDYIRNAYNTWEPAPSYVLLVGAVNKIPAFVTGGTPCVTDHPYACVDGNDYLADLFVGRLPAANTSELDVMVAKVLGYEMTPFRSDTSWYQRALMVGTSYQEGGGTPAVTALVTKRWVRDYLFDHGFSTIDTVFYPPTRYGHGPVDSAVNRGVLFINGRGWGNYDGWGYPEFLINDVYGLDNGWMLPVITSIYCGTGNYQRNPCFGEAWLRAGTPTAPRGAVAFWGSSYTGTSTRWNNCMDYGIYRAIFDHGVRTCAAAMYAGKLTQFENFPLPEDSFDLRLYFHVYNLLGDPALEMWTGVPQAVSMSCPASVPVGTSSFNVTVQDGSGQPVPGALVCLSKTGEVHVVQRTDASGMAGFAIATSTADSMLVTVTGPNLVPHLGRTSVVSPDVFVGHLSHSPDTVATGSAGIAVTLENFGVSQTAPGVQATLRALDQSASMTDSVRDYGDIGPGEAATAAGFGVTVASSCTSYQQIPFSLAITSGSNSWESRFGVTVRSPTLKVVGYTVHDANGVLEPGETAELSVLVRNSGGAQAQGLTGTLQSLNPAAVAVLDSTGGFGSVAPGDSASNSADRFQVRADPGTGVGRRFSLRLVMSGASGFEQSWDFPVTVGRAVASSPFGPDRHGYYAYDDVDAGYQEKPDFSWVEVDPAYGGSGTRLTLPNDTAIPVNLPFTFRFYGREYNAVSVSDNGYLAMGPAWLGDAYNWSIPSPMGPDGLVAAFWDDFRTDTLGASGLYTFDDATNHRFIAEWSRCVHVHGFRPPVFAEQQTFEVILGDPLYHQTRTGDGPVLVQYLAVQDDDTLWGNNHNYATVGIENPDHDDGLECTFAGTCPPASAQVGPNRAIRFTTNPPDTFTAVREVLPRAACGLCLRVRPSPARRRLSLSVTGTDKPVRVEVFDVLGRQVFSRVLESGVLTASWDLRDRVGSRVPAGVYQIVLTGLDHGSKLEVSRVLVLD